MYRKGLTPHQADSDGGAPFGGIDHRNDPIVEHQDRGFRGTGPMAGGGEGRSGHARRLCACRFRS